MMSKLGFIAAIVIFVSSMSGLAVAQEATPTPSPTATPTSTPSPTVTLTLFRDSDSLTLHIPVTGERISLAGLEYRVTLANGDTIARRLDQAYSSFLGLPFDQINALGTVCFRLVRTGVAVPIPLECGNTTLLLTQPLAAADVFWFDAPAGLERIVTVRQNDTFVGLCPPGQPACPITLAVQPEPPTFETPAMPTTLRATNTLTPNLTVTQTPTISYTATPTNTQSVQSSGGRQGQDGFFVELVDYEFRLLANNSDIAPVILTLRFINETDQSVEGLVNLRNITGVDNTETYYGEINAVVRRWCDTLQWPWHCNNVHEWAELENVAFTIPAHDRRTMRIELQKEGIKGDELERVPLQVEWMTINIPIEYRTTEFHQLIGQWRLER